MLKEHSKKTTIVMTNVMLTLTTITKATTMMMVTIMGIMIIVDIFIIISILPIIISTLMKTDATVVGILDMDIIIVDTMYIIEGMTGTESTVTVNQMLW